MGDVLDADGAGQGAPDIVAGKSIGHEECERISFTGWRGFHRVHQTDPSESKKKTESIDDMSWMADACS